ncbi:MAG TPA: serine acetyltransferase [Candidatus Paceibacterota bacterium]
MDIFNHDYYRSTGENFKLISGTYRLLISHALLYVFLIRKLQLNTNKVSNIFYRLLLSRMREKFGLEISQKSKIGKGFVISHAFNITISSEATIGENVSIFKGATIGGESRGIRIGAPTIGDKVWIGVNSTIVGKIKIGNNVLISPNSFVNFNVPDNSVVVGNPGKIIPSENATENYIIRVIKD